MPYICITTHTMSEARSIQQTAIDRLNDSAWEQRYSNTLQAFESAQLSRKMANDAAYATGAFYAGLNVSVCGFLLGRNEETMLPDLRSAVNHFELKADGIGLTRALNGLGNVYDSYGQYEKGLAVCIQGLAVARRINYTEGIADNLSTTGNIYSRLSDYSHALEAYQESLHIRETMHEGKAAASSLNLIARTYTSMGDFENGLRYYQRSIRLREELNDLGALPWNYLGLAALYEKKQEPEMALVYYSKSRTLNQQSKDKRLDLHCLIGIGRYRLLIRDTAKGLAELGEALNIALQLNAQPLLYEVHLLLAQMSELEEKTTQALIHYKKYHEVKEAVLNQEAGNRLKNQQITFAVERSEQEAEIHRLRNVELKSAHDAIAEKNKDITSSISYAQRIQQAILQKTGMLQEWIPASFILFKPKDIVSGDFYWLGWGGASTRLLSSEGVVQHENKSLPCPRILIAAADCTGHGVPGAFMSLLGVEKLNEALAFSPDTCEILSKLNKSIRKALRQTGEEGQSRDGMDIALISLNTGPDLQNGLPDPVILEYAGANRPLWILRKAAPEMEEIKATKMAIGGFTEDEQQFVKHEVTLFKGDRIYIFSDGYADQFGASGKKLKTSKFRELLIESRSLPMEDQQQYLDTFITNWRGAAEQTDDVLVIGVEV